MLQLTDYLELHTAGHIQISRSLRGGEVVLQRDYLLFELSSIS